MSSPTASTTSELHEVHNRILQSAWLLGEAHNSLKSLISSGSLDKEKLEKMRELMTLHKQYWGRFDALLEATTEVETEVETKQDDDPSEERGGIPEDEKKTLTARGPLHISFEGSEGDEDEEDGNPEDDDRSPGSGVPLLPSSPRR